jgi:hypothetical protein
VTITGDFMAAMIFKAPQFRQCSMSMSKTRLSSRAQPSAGAPGIEILNHLLGGDISQRWIVKDQ